MTDEPEINRAAVVLALTHWLVFAEDRRITGCHCGFRADPDDNGWGDSVLRHLWTVALNPYRSTP